MPEGRKAFRHFGFRRVPRRNPLPAALEGDVNRRVDA
jgi:hypothetical protein